ncbi:MAG: UDP-N-acetylmuramate--L-alanine ligase, partial [Deltaproteobacteria bacterium]|nr:UDP-N-acetylmuramate--L-alanine ligase [Deltaproteobacteria bacterium]
GEKPIEGVTGENLALAIKHTRVSYVSDLKNAVAPLASKLRAGDVVVTIGAGNVGQVAKEIAKTLGA